MSVRVMAAIWELPLPPTEKLVLLVIADHADDNGENAYPGVARIAKRASITERHTRRILQELVREGWLSIDRQMGGGVDLRSDRRPNRYRLNGVTSVSGRHAIGVTPVSERADMGVRNGVTPMSADTSLEPSTNSLPLEELLSRFNEFWMAYPRKVGKRDAQTTFVRLMRQREAPSQAQVLRAVAGLVAEGREMRFVPHPATWLRQGRWDDEVPVEETQPVFVEKPFCGSCQRGWVSIMQDGVERMARCECQT
jgi:hypothetical protein